MAAFDIADIPLKRIPVSHPVTMPPPGLAPQRFSPGVPGSPARVRTGGGKDPRTARRKQVALRCWAMKPSETYRGYVLDLSETGARIAGIRQGLALGQGLLLKTDLEDGLAPVILRAEAVRWHDVAIGTPHLAVRFLEVPFDDWFRIARHLDQA